MQTVLAVLITLIVTTLYTPHYPPTNAALITTYNLPRWDYVYFSLPEKVHRGSHRHRDGHGDSDGHGAGLGFFIHTHPSTHTFIPIPSFIHT